MVKLPMLIGASGFEIQISLKRFASLAQSADVYRGYNPRLLLKS